MNYLRDYFSPRVYFRRFLHAIVIMAIGVGLAFLSNVFGGAVVMACGVIVAFIGMALIPSAGYRDSKGGLMRDRRSTGGSDERR